MRVYSPWAGGDRPVYDEQPPREAFPYLADADGRVLDDGTWPVDPDGRYWARPDDGRVPGDLTPEALLARHGGGYPPWSLAWTGHVRDDATYSHPAVLGARYDALRAMDLERRHPSTGVYVAGASPDLLAEWMFFRVAADLGLVPPTRDGFIAARITRDQHPSHPDVARVWRAVAALPAIPAADGALTLGQVLGLQAATEGMDADAALAAWRDAQGYEYSERAGGWVPKGTTFSPEERIAIDRAAARCGIDRDELAAAALALPYADAAAMLATPHCGVLAVQVGRVLSGQPVLSGAALEAEVLGTAGGTVIDPRYAGPVHVAREGRIIDPVTGEVIALAEATDRIDEGGAPLPAHGPRPLLAGLSGLALPVAILGVLGAVIVAARSR